MMGYNLALYISTAALALVGLWRCRLQLTVVNAVQGVWVLVIALPSVLRYSGVDTVAKERLFVSTAIANVALLIAVLLGSSTRFQQFFESLQQRLPEIAEQTRRGLSRWFWGALGVSLGVFLLHGMLMPKIPLIELIFRGDLTASQLTQAREAANKLLPLPLAVKYLLYWNVRVLVPILLTALLLRGGMVAKVALSLLLVGLSTMTLEKSLPTFAIISCGLAVAVYRKFPLISRPVVLAFLLALSVAVGLETAIKFRDVHTRQRSAGVGTPTNDAERHNQPVETVIQEKHSLSWRAVAWYPIQFVGWRILTGPSDVAYAWFEYFPDVFGGYLHGRTWFVLDRAQPGFRHPANLVALYAYHSKDPERYSTTAHAYAAFHADAWANFGYTGVAMASVLVVVILMLTQAAVTFSNSAVTAGASGAALSILLTTLPSGGVQAALVAQGLLVCLGIALVPVWTRVQGSGRVRP